MANIACHDGKLLVIGSRMIVGHKVVGPVLRLIEDASQVFTHDAQTDELDGTKEENDANECRIASHRVAIDEGLDEGVGQIDESTDARKETYKGSQSQRSGGKADDTLNG